MSISGLPRPRLLVIDDEPNIAEFVMVVGELVGFAADQVNQPHQLAAELRVPPDVIVLDLMMPGMDGVQIMRQLAAANTQARVILMSGFDKRVLESASRLAQAHGLAVVGHLQKPVGLEQLREMLLAQRPVPLAGRPAPNIGWEELSRAITDRELVVHYQPQISLEDGRWWGVEALVRWDHPVHGMLAPNTFVPLAEKHGLGLELTYCVLETALSEHVAVVGNKRDRVLSINLPANAMHDLSFPERVLETVATYGASPAQLVFEVTETSLPMHEALSLDILTRLRLKGYGVSIDDFGTGHSSLDCLHQLPVTELKIDRRFVRVWQSDPHARAIVENAISLGRQLGVGVVAEGVEDRATLEWLAECGCHLAQGYFIGRPMPSTELADWEHQWKKYEPHAAARPRSNAC